MPFVRANESSEPKVAVFIPTWNGGELFEEVLTAIKAQETTFPFEILCIDSGSTDGTAERAERHGARVVRIPNREFNHGLTRNLAVNEARGDVVALTVQDATPATRDWLSVMVSHFEDPEVVGVFCHQIPRPDCDPFLKHRLGRWVKGGGEPSRRRVDSVEEFWSLAPADRWMRAQFDNVASAVRRSFALTHPFPRRQFGEDVTWAKQAVLALKTIVMEPRVAVIHSHKNSIWYEFKRAYLDHQNINDLFGVRLAPRLRDAIGATGRATRELWGVALADEALDLAAKIRWLFAAPYFALTQNLGQYLGPLSNVQGRRGLWKIWDRIMRRRV